MRRADEAQLTRQPDLEALEGNLWRREGARLCWLASRVPAGQAVVEIGSNRGKSACFLARGVRLGNQRGVKVHCVDLWDLGGQGEYQHLGFADPDVLVTFNRQIAEAKVKSLIVPIKSDSAAAAAAWSGPKVGLLFIDGDHRYEAVKRDFEAWLPHVAPGGVVAFHDYSRPFPKSRQFPGVVRFIDELRAQMPNAEFVRSGRVVSVAI